MGVFKSKILDAFLFKNKKNFLLEISECFKISPYPQIISLFGNVFKKSISDITILG